MSVRLVAAVAALLTVLSAASGQAAEKPGAAPGAPPAGKTDLSGLFAEPVALCDQDGKPIVTRRAVGHPIAFDWNADGKGDVVLGCHLNMDTATGEIRVLANVGTRESPRFRWPTNIVVRLTESPRGMNISCGCKSGGTPEVHVTDWNGDGQFDLVVDTYWSDGVRLFLNAAKPKQAPRFRRAEQLHAIGSHGKGSGGGDWTGDAVMDLVFPVNAYGWAVHPGVKGPGGGVKFAAKPAFASGEFKIVGQPRWFEQTPYAWNFSGRHPPGSQTAEIVAVMPDPDSQKKGYGEKRCHINYYWLDRAQKVCTLKGRLATSQAALTRLGIGDLNGDGCMDVLYTGGVFTKGDETRIWALYGKVKNIPKARKAK